MGWRGRLIGALALALLGVAAVFGTGPLARWGLAELEPPPLERAGEHSPVVLDRHGRLLRPFATKEGRWRLPVRVEDVDPRYLALLLAYEDKRFRSHPGVDALALARAAWQWALNGRIVSGGSTLTMQVARLLEPEGDRSLGRKAREIGRALALERDHAKDEVLRLYLALAPFGGNLEGIRAASLSYFGKEPNRLSDAEAALLVALPQSPEARRPDRSAGTARRARDRVLARAARAGVLSPEEVAAATAEPVPEARQAFPVYAAHAAEAALAGNPQRTVHRLTIDRKVQEGLERLARDRVRGLGDRVSAAVLVVRHATGEVVAHVGGTGLFDEARAGHVDLTRAVRSPGSTLKPFIYGLAFEDGLAHPETLIEDRPTRFGAYAPENFDDGFHGTVTAREALGRSLNVPAVQLLEAVGPNRLSVRLKSAGARLVLPATEAPGLAVGLGGAGLRLVDLAGLYAALARGGEVRPLRIAEGETAGEGVQLMDRVAAWYVGEALAGAPPPAGAPRGRLAFKTGTSYGYRDAWAVGFDGRHTVAVWVGRPDGAPVPGLTGLGAAAPLLFDAFVRVEERRTPLPAAPRGALMARNAELPLALRRFRAPGELPALDGDAATPLELAFPPDGAELAQAARADLTLKAQGGTLPLTWFVDGRLVGSSTLRREIAWQPSGPGFARISVVDASGTSRTASVRVAE